MEAIYQGIYTYITAKGLAGKEELGLVFHPFSRTLHPMRMMLA